MRRFWRRFEPPIVSTGRHASELAARYPLSMASPPARNVLNSSLANVQSLRASETEPHLEIHSVDAVARGIANGIMVHLRGQCRLRRPSKAIVRERRCG
ncbi:hypothetical protein KQH60_01635 [Mycetohabitans sp. B8]|uniref:hypothetical protein n=1 Tax=Mycetohabitans sp. B8 TaxID=2841845 RepID=UPI001F44B06E|nr:hypothetical protein [Mycetohabitans sp. B8]MCG1041333.1 hypothetical protein [Mycetohabitans sp. B8]